MKRLQLPVVLGLAIILALAACSQSEGQANEINTTNDSQNGGSPTVDSSGAEEDQVETIIAQINENADALSPVGQLALGTLRLEDGELAVTEEQAVELLPLWQALQSLSNSETTAQAELDAVVRQIQGIMTAEQVASIAGMKLTADNLTEMLQSGELGFRGLGGRNATGESEDGAAFAPGGLGTGPGGGFGPGGGLGGGPGGFGGGFAGNLSEDDIATRRAGFAESTTDAMGDQFLIGAVVRLMQSKTGDVTDRPGGMFDAIFTLVADQTGLTTEEIQTAMADGQSLAEIIENYGGDIEVVRAAMIEAFEALPNAEELDAKQQADQWLNNQQPGQ